MKCRQLFLLAALAAGTLSQAQSSYSIIWDDFKNGFTAGAPDSKWFYFAAGPFVGNDAVVSTSNKGLHVSSNPYSLTMAQEGSPENPFSFPGGFDHVKWLVYCNHLASSGYPGFDAVPGKELEFTARFSGTSYGNENHPFGALVSDPDDDIRLACSAMPSIDFENFLVADFFVTNKRIYALYERLPFLRTPTNNYAAFTYAIPVAERMPWDEHHLTIGYDRSKNLIRWSVNGREVFRVSRPGYRLPTNEHMIIDHGGVEEDVTSRQRNIGFGVFTLLDAASPTQQALVRLSTAPDFYYNTGLPGVPQTFYDELSLASNRVWGAGATLSVRNLKISSK